MTPAAVTVERASAVTAWACLGACALVVFMLFAAAVDWKIRSIRSERHEDDR